MYESLDKKKDVESTPKGVRRRFSDFVWLRDTLAKCFPGVLLPPLPPKKLLGNMNEAFIKSRCVKLQIFMERLISRMHFISQSLPFKIFVTKVGEEFKAEKKKLSQFFKTSWTRPEICALYERLFRDRLDIMRPEIPKDPADMVEFMRSFLLETRKHVLALAKHASSAANSLDHIAAESTRMGTTLSSTIGPHETPAKNCNSTEDNTGRENLRDSLGEMRTETEYLRDTYAIVARCAIDEAEDTAAMMEVVCCWDAFRKELDRSKKIYGADVECEKLFVILTRLLFFSEVHLFARRKEPEKGAEGKESARQRDRG
uniref:PX domain-containing protein n=2 Tax=Lotharella globosa TaxID=91324 RepID=A0A7S3YTV3_9EUKA